MPGREDNWGAACDEIAAAIARIAAAQSGPVVVALDGASGAGKSTLAGLLQARLLGQFGRVAVVPLDDFFAAQIPDTGWAARSAAEKVRDVHEWERVRVEALEPLRAGRPARWHPFDFAAGQRPDGTYGCSTTAELREPAPVILLDGAYAGAPQLADLVDLAVLVDVPQAERHRRLAAREDAAFLADWHARWDEAEAHYFGQVRPPQSYDLVVKGA
jgi:uridine kinase